MSRPSKGPAPRSRARAAQAFGCCLAFVLVSALSRPTALAAASAENNPLVPAAQQVNARFSRIQQ